MPKFFNKGMPKAIIVGIIIGLVVLLAGESIIYRKELGEAINSIPDLITSIQLKLTKNPEKRCKIQKGTWVESKNCCRPHKCVIMMMDCSKGGIGSLSECCRCWD